MPADGTSGKHHPDGSKGYPVATENVIYVGHNPTHHVVMTVMHGSDLDESRCDFRTRDGLPMFLFTSLHLTAAEVTSGVARTRAMATELGDDPSDLWVIVSYAVGSTVMIRDRNDIPWSMALRTGIVREIDRNGAAWLEVASAPQLAGPYYPHELDTV